jgi:hypothetical protein
MQDALDRYKAARRDDALLRQQYGHPYPVDALTP